MGHQTEDARGPMPLPRRWLRVKRCDRFPIADENFSPPRGIGRAGLAISLEKTQKNPRLSRPWSIVNYR